MQQSFFSCSKKNLSEVSRVSKRALSRLWERNDHKNLAIKAFALARGGQDVAGAFSLDPFEDDWHDFLRECMNFHVKRCCGHVYAAANPVHGGLHKVGQTGLSVDARLKALVKEGVFGYFQTVHSITVPDRFYAEAKVHRLLTSANIPRHKEFFKVPHGPLILLMDHVLAEENALLKRLGIDGVKVV